MEICSRGRTVAPHGQNIAVTAALVEDWKFSLQIAIFQYKGESGYGFILTDGDGRFLCAMVGLLEGVFQLKIVEAIEIWEALSWIRLHRSNVGVVYLNSQIVINVPYSNEIDNSEFGLQIGKLMWRL
ncbi:hypothetical protein ACFE04_028171 [Oxalis oulophora]